MRLLENLGFEWRDSKRDAGREKEEWRRRFEELRKFQSKYGHCRVPLDKTSPNLLLGIWVKNQRKQYRLYHKKKAPATGGIGRGSSSFNSTAGPISTSMTKERIRLLKRIGFEWRLKDEYEWKRKFEELQLYKSQHGDCRVPSRYPANVALGRWVRRQRKQYRFLRTGRKSLLNEEKVSILEAIGFEWKGPSNKLPYDPVEEEEWKRKYEGLCQYKSEHGNCFIREDYTDISLVAWVAEQQNQYIMLRDGKPSSMSRERIRLLDKVGFCWPAPIPTTPSPTPNDGSETAAVLDLSIPALPHVSIGLPISSESNYTASASAAVDAPAPVPQVHHLHKQTSHPDQSEFPVPSKRLRSDVDTLSSLPPVVDDPRWMGRYNELLQYRDQHGDCRVPLRYSENPALGRWVSAQRRDYKTWEKDGASSSLTEAKLNLLNSVGFVWLASGERGWGGKRKAAQDKLWSTRYDEMSQYKSQFGDCRVPKTCHQYPSLRRWVDIQRSEFAKIQRGEGSPILTGERIRLLDALGFEWGIDDRHMARSFAAAAKGENGDGVISTTQQSHRTSSLAVPSSDVDFSTLTPSRSFAQASSKHGEANNGEGGQKQPPKVSTMMIGTAGMHGQHQHHRHHHHMNSGVNLSNQQPSPLPTEISFRKRETDKGGG